MMRFCVVARLPATLTCIADGLVDRHGVAPRDVMHARGTVAAASTGAAAPSSGNSSGSSCGGGGGSSGAPDDAAGAF
eukprot:288608-Chlamydomonas_euryale.AAC.1